MSNKLEHQLAQDISYGLYKGHSICAIVLNKTTTTTIQDELQHFARLDNVLFVPFMTEESVNDKASRDCYHVMCGHGNENDVIPLRLFGLDKRYFGLLGMTQIWLFSQDKAASIRIYSKSKIMIGNCTLIYFAPPCKLIYGSLRDASENQTNQNFRFRCE